MLFPDFVPPRTIRLRPAAVAPVLRPWAPGLVRLAAAPYLVSVGYRSLETAGEAGAARLWESFYQGNVRLIAAFRHPYGNDPQVISAAVARLRLPGGRPPFIQFVHGSEVGWWSGPAARWILPRVGGLPVDHGKLGPSQVDAIKQAILEGPHPLALAPEGQVTYSAWDVQRVEPGFARLGFLAAEELASRGSRVPVVVLPVSLFQRYPRGTLRRLDRVLSRMERQVFGLGQAGAPWERLNRLRDGIFLLAERWYARFQGGAASVEPWSSDRLVPLLETALTAGERILGLAHDGEYFARLYRLRSLGWDRLYPPDSPVTPLEKRLAYRSSVEAWSAFRHMELADIAWYLGTGAPGPGSDPGVLADYAENLFDLIGRLSGGNISHRKCLFPRSVRVVYGDGIDLSARLGSYRTKKKETLADVIAELTETWRRTASEELDGRS